jgi:hypothetical protein
MSGLREAVVGALASEITNADVLAEHLYPAADAVLRVLAEHGDTQQVREQIIDAVVKHFEDQRGHPPEQMQINDLTEYADAVMAAIAPHLAASDAAIDNLLDDNEQTLADAQKQADRAERAEADLAAARQQLDQVREGIAQAIEKHAEECGDPADNAYEYARIARQFDAPARPARHDESGQ